MQPTQLPPMTAQPTKPLQAAPMTPQKPFQPAQSFAPSAAYSFALNAPTMQLKLHSPGQQFAWQGAPGQFNQQSAGTQSYLTSAGGEFERGAPKAASDPMANQSPCSGCPDPNSGRPINQRAQPNEDVPMPPPVRAPGKPAQPSCSTELLYKAALALIPDPMLFKLAGVIGVPKHQPSPMKVTAVGEGDTSRLKVKPWQVNGAAAWEGIKSHK